MNALNWIAVAGVATLAVLAAVHALLFKRDPRAAFGWVAVCLMFPVAGPILYFLFGINRIKLRAAKLGRIQRLPFDLRHAQPDLEGARAAASHDVPARFADIVATVCCMARVDAGETRHVPGDVVDQEEPVDRQQNEGEQTGIDD